MSLSVALSAATSSLIAIEKQMSVASNNIANASTAGYTEETVSTAATTANGTGTGVEVTGVTSSTNQYLLKSIAAQTSTSSFASTVESYLETLDNAMGSLSASSTSDATQTSTSSLSSLLDTLNTDLSSLATTPDSTSLQTTVVNDLSDVAASLRDTSSTVQSERGQADQEIASTVTDANTQLATIEQLNKSIQSAKSDGNSTAALEDQRNTALQALSSDLGVNYFIDGNGNAQVYTSSGQALIDSTGGVHDLSYTASGSISSSSSYPDGGISGIYVGNTDITSSITTGTIGALIQMRDKTLPAVQSELDGLASTLSTALNTISNQGSANPPPTTLTGTTDVSATDALNVASGTTLQLVLTDANGDTTSSTDIDISGATTVSQLLADLNSVSGVSATITDGHLQITNSSGGGVALSTESGSVGGTNMSAYFGLNDLLTGGSSAATIAVNPNLLSQPSLLSTGTLEDPQTVGSAAVAASDGSIATALEDALNNNQSFAAAGSLGTQSTSFAGYASSIVSGVAAQYSTATSNATTASTTLSTLTSSFDAQSGVNTDNETAKLQSLENAYAASAQVISVVKSMFTALLTAVQS